jgi:hypothetical protein
MAMTSGEQVIWAQTFAVEFGRRMDEIKYGASHADTEINAALDAVEIAYDAVMALRQVVRNERVAIDFKEYPMIAEMAGEIVGG